MKIWRNDKRVIRIPQYIHCEDCVLCGNKFDYCFECLAVLYKIHNTKQVCLSGYKYESDV